MMVEPGNILKLFLNFSNFEPQYSYRLYSYKKKECNLYKFIPNSDIRPLVCIRRERSLVSGHIAVDLILQNPQIDFQVVYSSS